MEQALYCFGAFELDVRSRQLSRSGTHVKLSRQCFDLLLLLVVNAGRVVMRKEIEEVLWKAATPIDVVLGINRCVKEIRKALKDNPRNPNYIRTHYHAGYCFIAEVEKKVREAPAVYSLVKAVQLTTNSSAASPIAAALSPDGKLLAHAGPSGLHILVLATRESYPVRAANGLKASYIAWLPDSTTLLVSAASLNGPKVGVWLIPILANKAMPIARDAEEACAFVDAQRLVFTAAGGRELWIASLREGKARQLLSCDEGEFLRELSWLAENKVCYARVRSGLFRFDISLELLDLASCETQSILSEPRLRGACAHVVGEKASFVYSLAEPPNLIDTNLWATQIDLRTAHPTDEARKITDFRGWRMHSLSIASDAARLAFINGSYHGAIYVGDLADNGTLLRKPKPLTLNLTNDLPTAWTPDSKSVIFHSDRNGKWEIFRQPIRSATAEVIAAGPDDCRGARICPDGTSILYFARPPDQVWPMTVMRGSLDGGLPSPIVSEVNCDFRCGRTRCVFSVRKGEELLFRELEPSRGPGREILRTKIDTELDQTNWDLSPDGQHVAILIKSSRQTERIRVVRLADGHVDDLTVDGWPSFQSIDWAADGRGWYVSSRSGRFANLLHIDLQCRTTALRHQPGSFITWAVPSPDGRRLALLEWASEGNVWMLEGS